MPSENANLLDAFSAIATWWRRLDDAERDAYLNERFPVVYSYNSGKIENDEVTLHDTEEVFERGRVIGYTGDVRTLFEICNLKAAWNETVWLAKQETKLTVDEMLHLHRTLTTGTYDERRWERGERPGTFKKGDYAVAGDVGYEPSEVADAMDELADELSNALSKSSPAPPKALMIAAYAHAKTVDIHPFADGNGRFSRALQNVVLLRLHCPPIMIDERDRMAYYGALDAFHLEGRMEDYRDFCAAEALKTWGDPMSRSLAHTGERRSGKARRRQ